MVKILHIEDNPGDLMLTRELLEEAGLDGKIETARDGVSAVELLKNDDLPDLIMLDLNIPKKDGRELLAEIKNNERTNHLPILIFTSSKAQADIDDCYQYGANSYIIKPKDLGEFSQTINAIHDFWLGVCRLPSSPA